MADGSSSLTRSGPRTTGSGQAAHAARHVRLVRSSAVGQLLGR